MTVTNVQTFKVSELKEPDFRTYIDSDVVYVQNMSITDVIKKMNRKLEQMEKINRKHRWRHKR